MSNKHILNSRSIFYGSVMENINKIYEKSNFNISNSKDLNYNDYNYNGRITFSKRLNDKINNINHENTNLNIKTSEISINNDIFQHKK